ncbi:MAG TPA: hypothetical protein VGE01_13910, partial [Fimbriimonas sp.]
MSTALGMCAILVLATGANAQRRSGAENSLVGIRLYDPGSRVVSIYGSPTEIQPVVLGGGGGGAPGGMGGARGGNPFGGPGGPPGGFPGMPGGRMGGGAPGMSPSLDYMNPFNFGNDVLRQMPPGMPPAAPGMPPSAPGGMGRPGMPGGYPGGMPGMPGGMPGMPGGMPGAGAGGRMAGGGGAAQNAQDVTYTRWVYNRGGSRYGFIIDRYGRVVQIEAIGIQNAKVRTRKGIGFGSTFATIIKRY